MIILKVDDLTDTFLFLMNILYNALSPEYRVWEEGRKKLIFLLLFDI